MYIYIYIYIYTHTIHTYIYIQLHNTYNKVHNKTTNCTIHNILRTQTTNSKII